jgi:hypothetical protein
MKKLGLLWGTIALVVFFGLVTIIPNFSELWADHSFWIYVAVVVTIAAASIYTTYRK